jgi:hypothetical protein
MGAARNFSFPDVIFIIEGRNITGYSEDGTIAFSRFAPPGEVSEGADGEPTFSKSASRGMYVSVTCRQSGLAFRDLNELLQAQEDDVSIGYSVNFIDPVGGTRLSAGGCKFVEAGDLSFASKVGDQEFKLYMPYALDTAQFGTEIVGGS